MTSFTYVIPDLHGRLDLFERAIAEILAHAAGAVASVITLGDYVDRGPASRQLVERLMHWDEMTLRLVALKGNHEAMMWQACNGLLEAERWLLHGGDATLASYGTDPSGMRTAVPKAHLAWLNGLPLVHVDQHRAFVHAGVDQMLPLDQQNESTVLWKRYASGHKKGHGILHVVHGHDGTSSAPVVTTGKSNLDGLAWKTGRLVLGVYADHRPGAAVEYLEILGPPIMQVS
jgi:serine/threonine protein phosphatase 1